MTQVTISYESDEGDQIDYEVEIPWSRIHLLVMRADELIGEEGDDS